MSEKSLHEAAINFANEAKDYQLEGVSVLHIREMIRHAFTKGVFYQAPISRAEGYATAIDIAYALDLAGFAAELKEEGIRLGILPGDKKEGGGE